MSRQKARPSRATEKIRDDIDPATTWLVSDTHFGHDNIVGFCHRPLDHEQVMIAEWRKEVPDDATVLHLGDLCYRSNARFKNLTAPELTGARKLLIAGNHDRQRYSFYRDSGFKLTRPFSIKVFPNTASGMALTKPNDESSAAKLVSFSHYPWSLEDDGREMHPQRDIRIHGHIHNNGYSRDEFVPFLRNHINLSLEQTKYKPVNLKLLLDAVILGEYPETTQEQLDEAARRKAGER
jgi:calcineurin-like phosphoesterase family protein